MRLLEWHRPGGAFGVITDSWINALRDKGHVVQRWNNVEASWHVFNPDLYIGCSGHRQSIPTNRGSCKIALHVNPYGPIDIPGINESQDSINWVKAQSPDVVFGYGHANDEIFWRYWTDKLLIKWAPMPTAGDKVVFKQLQASKQYDLVYLGGHWAYKGLTIDKLLLPVLRSGLVNYKLYGWGDWPDGICSGPLPEDQACAFLNSGRVGPCISELHTHNYGIDVPERAFKVALCGALIVHDQTISIKQMIPSAIVARSEQEFHDYCYYYSRPENETERLALVAKQQSEVLSANTYHNRMSTLFEALGFADEAKKMVS